MSMITLVVNLLRARLGAQSEHRHEQRPRSMGTYAA